MQIDKHLESVRNGVEQAAALADEHSQDIARRLGGALESSVRLALIEALSDAATEISADLAPGSVEFRLSNGEPQFVVSLPPTPGPVTEPDPEPAYTPTDEDEEQVRVTLRLPASVKKNVDERADADGMSTNTWLMQLVLRELGRRGRGNLGDYIESTIEQAIGMSPTGSWGGHTGAPRPPAAPFPPGFPFQGGPPESGGRNRRRDRDNQYRGWAQ